MTTAIKRRRGTTTQHSTFTGLEGEITIDTTKDTAVVHDGLTAGGLPLLREDLANNTEVVTKTGTQTLTNKTLTSPVINTPTLVTPVLGVATATSVTVSGVVGTSATDALVLPSGTTGQRGASTAGKIRYNSTTSSFEGYGTAWGSIGGGATGAGGDQVFQENQLIVTTNYTLSTGKSAISKGPITINAGVVVTIPSSYSWLVL